jgi:hypothetical protein
MTPITIKLIIKDELPIYKQIALINALETCIEIGITPEITIQGQAHSMASLHSTMRSEKRKVLPSNIL